MKTYTEYILESKIPKSIIDVVELYNIPIDSWMNFESAPYVQTDKELDAMVMKIIGPYKLSDMKKHELVGIGRFLIGFFGRANYGVLNKIFTDKTKNKEWVEVEYADHKTDKPRAIDMRLDHYGIPPFRPSYFPAHIITFRKKPLDEIVRKRGGKRSITNKEELIDYIKSLDYVRKNSLTQDNKNELYLLGMVLLRIFGWFNSAGLYSY